MNPVADLVAKALAHRKAGRLEEALLCYRRAADAAPGHLPVLAGIADLLRAMGRLEEAVPWFEKAIAAAPDHPELYDNLALVLLQLRRYREVERVLRQGVARLPRAVSTMRNLGMVLSDSGRPGDAIPWLQRIVEMQPRNAGYRKDLGIALQRMQAYGAAETQYRKALELAPDDLEALNNLGSVIRLQGRLTEAEGIYRQALAVDPEFADVLANLGSALREQGRIGAAKEVFRRALAVRSPWPNVHSNLIFCLDFDGEAGLQEQQEERRRWREAIEAPLRAARRASPGPAGGSQRGKRLRVGYVSADFNRHSASDMFGAVLMNHDLSGLDVVLYSGGDREDDRTAEFAAHCTTFRRVKLFDDQALADLIEADGIDILVDLSGHSAGNRLPVFARRPAPVQVTAWGYATGTGLSSMDVFLADGRLVPEGLRHHFTERIVELSCFLSYRAPEYLPEVAPLPALDAGHVTFGNFNRLAKASEQCLLSWADLLLSLPGSRLLLKCKTLDDGAARQRVLDLFGRKGVAAERVDLRGTSPHVEQLRCYGDVDVALDPFPHCGGTTTCEALSMGVPVVSLCGQVPVSRNGLSLLSAIDFREWVAHDLPGYLATARALAGDLPRLAAIREGLRDLVRASPLGDNAAYAREVEGVYRRLWLRHCMEAGGQGRGGTGSSA